MELGHGNASGERNRAQTTKAATGRETTAAAALIAPRLTKGC